jgi:wyosine [tRNA(Phe)-imidazoG37] synthetase (radical SAM superfamily)
MMRTVYGPFRSWRLGQAIGVDAICRQPKVCNMKCAYCRLGCGGIMVTERSRFVDEAQVREEASELLEKGKIDVVEFRGTGEPFLAKNLHEIALTVRELTDAPFGIVTNGSMLSRADVQKELADYDVVIVKLDAADEAGLKRINHPHASISFLTIINAIRETLVNSDADIIIQVTFYRDNLASAARISDLIREIGPDQVFLSTPQCPGLAGLSRKDLADVNQLFHGMKVRTIFDD